MWRFNNPLPMPLYQGEDGSGEGAGGPGTGEPAGDAGEKSGEKKSNGESNLEQFANLWQDPVEDKKEPQAKEPAQEPATKEDGNKQFNDHLATLNFLDGVDLDKVSQDLQSGDTKSLQSVLTTQAQNVYKRALIDSNNLMDQKVSKAVEEAVQKSRTSTHGDMAVRVMEGTLKFTKDSALNPIAKAVLGRLMNQGQDVDEAIGNVKKFFEHTAKISEKELGKQRAPRNAPGGDFKQPPDMSVGDGREEDPDWMSFLSE